MRKSRAVRDGDSYRINGVKHFISNAAEARCLVVFAKTDPEAGARGVSAFVVDTQTPGLHVSSHEKLMGIRGTHAFEVSFDQLAVPLSCRLGEEGSGFKTAMKVLDNAVWMWLPPHWVWRRQHWTRPCNGLVTEKQAANRSPTGRVSSGCWPT